MCFGILVQEFLKFFKKYYFWLCKNPIENWLYPIETQTLKFWSLWVVIHPELCIEILRPMEKELAQLDIPFLAMAKKLQFFWDEKCYFWLFFNIVSPVEAIPVPWFLEFLYATLEKELVKSDLIYWRNNPKIAFLSKRNLTFLAKAKKW